VAAGRKALFDAYDAGDEGNVGDDGDRVSSRPDPARRSADAAFSGCGVQRTRLLWA
jgi:hypothetical protein